MTDIKKKLLEGSEIKREQLKNRPAYRFKKSKDCDSNCEFLITQADITPDGLVISQGNHIYCLAENINFTGVDAAITIAANNVVLDFKNFTLSGSTNSGITSIGVNILDNFAKVLIKNGYIKNIGSGILCAAGSNILINNMKISNLVGLAGIGIFDSKNVIIKNVDVQEIIQPGPVPSFTGIFAFNSNVNICDCVLRDYNVPTISLSRFVAGIYLLFNIGTEVAESNISNCTIKNITSAVSSISGIRIENYSSDDDGVTVENCKIANIKRSGAGVASHGIVAGINVLSSKGINLSDCKINNISVEPDQPYTPVTDLYGVYSLNSSISYCCVITNIT
ncbi:MAG: hypothetical protein Harvfovirus29_2 [Harvfovirus sp.]|uniref:Uncharacterized protein n=1 Tax=Harvfovirus sp. TaxID=2487768 RepID=A0A3G5A6A4_9VIRU|nr:MAG: hypothetical protein Harvfovirus29_2 [Harvfovirus sp.]